MLSLLRSSSARYPCRPLALVTSRMGKDGLPHIPGGVAIVAVLALAVGLWMWLDRSTNPESGPLRLVGFLIALGAMAVLCETMGFFRVGVTPW
jgi:hypothetical protein